ELPQALKRSARGPPRAAREPRREPPASEGRRVRPRPRRAGQVEKMTGCSLYNAFFFLYVFIVPAFLQYLIRAPSTFTSAPFYPVPLATLQGKVAHVNMSSPPQTMEEGVNHCKPCYEDQYHKTGMYQWNIMLRMSYADLMAQSKDNPVTTMYPVILASNDFKLWKVVADADDVNAGMSNDTGDTTKELVHIAPPLLVAALKPFGCVTNETGTTDPFQWFFASGEKANRYKWRLVDHVSTHGSVHLVACVMEGFDKVNAVMTYFAQNCINAAGKMVCERTPREVLGQCFALGSACGQACGFFSPTVQHCSSDGHLDPMFFQGLTSKRVSIKTASGGGASNALVNCDEGDCKTGLSFKGMYAEADNPNDFVVDSGEAEMADFYTILFAMSEVDSGVAVLPEAEAKEAGTKEDSAEDEADDFGFARDRRLQISSTKYAWQIAHMPNLTLGVFKDHSSNTMRIDPTKESCFAQPGFTYMVACMTSEPVFTSGNGLDIAGPPFNDRCLAVGGLCGAVCGSGQTLDDEAKKYCPEPEDRGRRLDGALDYSPYASTVIPMEHLVSPIEPRRSATTKSTAASFFFHGFIFFVTVSYVATILSKFPGNFSDFYPMHTWDELRTHGYVLEKFGCAAAFGISAGEHKMIVLRNWIGKIAARPEFEDRAFPTFRRWVDAFADEGHREGARLLWLAWTDFLDTNPPVEFLEEWSDNLREQSWEAAHSNSPFELTWGAKRVLPVTPSQAQAFAKMRHEAVPEGGVELQQDSLARLRDMADLYSQLPGDMRLEQSLSKKDDCVLTREVNLSLKSESAKKRSQGCYTIKYGQAWIKEMDAKFQERTAATGSASTEQYKKQLAIMDAKGRSVPLAELTKNFAEARFPLHFREMSAHKDRKLIMIYMARARPETERKGIEKTRGLDKYLWACLKPSAVRPYPGENGTRKQFKRRKVDGKEFEPLLSHPPGAPKGIYDEVRRCVQDILSRQHKKFLDQLEEPAFSQKKNMRGHRELAEEYLKYRVVESDWELGRWCYGEIVGEDQDVDGDEVLILDNPSSALLELVSGFKDAKQAGMGLVALETVEEVACTCFVRDLVRVGIATSPSLEFLFSAYDEDEQSTYNAQAFEKEFRAKLRGIISEQAARGLQRCTVTQYQQGLDLTVEIQTARSSRRSAAAWSRASPC
ncbi:unnamed protein product, partial [Prorocentrum cordatum]